MNIRQAEFETAALPHLDDVYTFARWLCRSAVEADDVVQEAMLRAYRAFDARRIEAVRPWLLAIVRNCFNDQAAAKVRSRGRLASSDGLEQAASEAPSPEEEAVWTSERRRLDRMLGILPAAYREVLLLREMEDLSYREIADIIDAPIGTVMSRLARARALLKDHWKAEDIR